MEAIEHLSETVWSKPDHYYGFSPDGDYLIYSRHRDSTILENCNYYGILSDLQEKAKEYGDEGHDENGEPFIYDWRASCSMFGWHDYIMVSQSAPDELKQFAGEIYCSISDYPIYNEMAYSEAQYNAVCEYWESESIQGRIDLCVENGYSIFASRSDSIPESVFDSLMDSEMFY